MEGGERAGACPWWGRGVAPPPPPTLEIEKKDAVRGNFNLFHKFHLCFTYEIRGESIHLCLAGAVDNVADPRLL